jgi:hypothetical protein
MPVPVLTSTNSAAASTEISAPGLASSAFKRRVSIVNTDANALCVRIGQLHNRQCLFALRSKLGGGKDA